MADMRDALKLAIQHIEHMAAWISARNSNIAYEGAVTYSFEALGEDMPGIKAAVSSPQLTAEEIQHIKEAFIAFYPTSDIHTEISATILRKLSEAA